MVLFPTERCQSQHFILAGIDVLPTVNTVSFMTRSIPKQTNYCDRVRIVDNV